MIEATEIESGEVLVLPPYTYFTMECCRCGFAHKVFLMAPEAQSVMMVFFEEEKQQEESKEEHEWTY